MIYTVECSFTDPESEAKWNDFYSSEKLPALISVSGFHSSQRFKALNHGCPVYLAIHSVDGLEVLTSEEYRRKGGGNFARWQQYIVDWHRNLYEGIERASDITRDEVLAISASGSEPLEKMGLSPIAMQAVALERYPERRWLAKFDRTARLVDLPPAGVHLYEPITRQLVKFNNPSTKSSS